MNFIRKAKQILLTTILIGLLPFVVYAAPSVLAVNGNIITGATVIITGTGFGTHPNYNAGSYSWKGSTYLPFAFKDYEDNSLTSQGFSATGNRPNIVTVQNGGPTNSTRYLRAQYVDGTIAGYGPTQSGNNTSSIYTSFWFMMPSGTEGGKPWRWYFGPNSSNDNLYLGKSCGSVSFTMGGDLTANAGYGAIWGNTISASVWHKVEIWASEPAARYQVWLDGSLYLDFTASTGSNIWTLSHTMSPNGHTVEFPDMIDGGEYGCGTRGAFNYDDIYVDYTPARVEICNGSTWNSRGMCNTQVPTSWSAMSIDVVVNMGTFALGNTKYLYVVDSTNTANANGIAVTFGRSSSSKGASVPPGNLR